MGITVEAECKCGFEASSHVGGGRVDCGKVEPFPAICNSCKNLVDVNTAYEVPCCPECGSADVTLYNDESLIGQAGFMNEAQNFDLVLTNGTYKCPKCGDYTLQFVRTGIFD